MRIISLATVTMGTALALSVAPSAAKAGVVCDRVNLSSPCVSGSDLEPSIRLGGSGDQGRLRVRNADNEIAVELRGSNGNVTNLFSNSASQSNGLVKAWARINADGTVESCWRCNKDESETRKLDTGGYVVDFTPLSTDIRGRPRGAIHDGLGGDTAAAVVRVTDSADASSMLVFTNSFNSGDRTDASFVLVIY